MKLVKYYVEFKVDIDPLALSKNIRNIYVVGDTFLANRDGALYVFKKDMVSVCALVTETNPWNLDSVRNCVTSCIGTTASGFTTRVIYETELHLDSSEMALEKLHYDLADKPPPGTVLNIYEPTINERLIVKFSVSRDGFTSTFHISTSGECVVVCDTRRCSISKTEEECISLARKLKESLIEYL